jgi:hypothetical protein
MECRLRESEQRIDVSEEYRNLVSFIRSRLDVISTSLYLLERSCQEENIELIKYLKKINDEMESIRKFINI